MVLYVYQGQLMSKNIVKIKAVTLLQLLQNNKMTINSHFIHITYILS